MKVNQSQIKLGVFFDDLIISEGGEMSIILKKPLSLLERNVVVDTKSLGKTVLKIVAKTVSLKWMRHLKKLLKF